VAETSQPRARKRQWGLLFCAQFLGIFERSARKFEHFETETRLAAINKSHAAGDLFRLYLLATREGADFNLAVIPSTFSVRPNRPFDPGYMAALFEAGLNHAGSQWLKRPPELER
jgi:hypothetical protein